MKTRSILNALVALMSVTAATNDARAAFDTYLRIKGVEGESTSSSGHANWVNVEISSIGTYRNAATGELEQSLVIKRATDEHSPALVRAFLDGTIFEELELATANSDSQAAPFDLDTFEPFRNMVIVGYNSTIGGVDDGMEEFTFVAVEREMKESGEKSDADGETRVALLLPAVQAAREAATTTAADDSSASGDTGGTGVANNRNQLWGDWYL